MKEIFQLKKVAILTRGYRSKAEHAKKSLHLNQSLGLIASVEECGDEPLLLSRLLPSVDIWVGKNRICSAKIAASAGAELLFLDDGFQHRKIKRDFEVIVLDGKDPFGKGFFLPRGLLRDSIKRLEKADLLVANHIENAEQFGSLEQNLKSFSNAPLVGACMKPKENSLQGKKVGVFCGLGKPQRFVETVQKTGADIVDLLLLPDHKGSNEEQLKQFAEKCFRKGAECLICTEKDLVKLTQPKNDSSSCLCIPIVPLSATFEIVFGKEKWTKAILQFMNMR